MWNMGKTEQVDESSSDHPYFVIRFAQFILMCALFVGHPDLSGNCRCVQMQSNGLWRTLDCSHTSKFICEMLPGNISHLLLEEQGGITFADFSRKRGNSDAGYGLGGIRKLEGEPIFLGLSRGAQELIFFTIDNPDFYT